MNNQDVTQQAWCSEYNLSYCCEPDIFFKCIVDNCREFKRIVHYLPLQVKFGTTSWGKQREVKLKKQQCNARKKTCQETNDQMHNSLTVYFLTYKINLPYRYKWLKISGNCWTQYVNWYIKGKCLIAVP